MTAETEESRRAHTIAAIEHERAAAAHMAAAAAEREAAWRIVDCGDGRSQAEASIEADHEAITASEMARDASREATARTAEAADIDGIEPDEDGE